MEATTYKTFSNSTNNIIILRLIYFWAFVEAGLGGVLHMLHIPLTGFVVGGFSVVINVLIAKYSNNNAAVFLKALGIVLAVKFLLSPYTPFGAYVAVSFQGLMAAFLFSVFGLNALTILIFSTLAMLESALQKPLMAYILFGKEFWVMVLNLLSNTFKISKEKIETVGYFLFAVYILLYIAWACVLSLWANNLRKNITSVLAEKEVELIAAQISTLNKRSSRAKKNRLFTIIFLLITFLMIYGLSSGNVAWSSFLRTLLLLIFLLIIIPYFIKRHQQKLFNKNKTIVQAIAHEIPQLKTKTILAWQMANPYRGLKKFQLFVSYALWLNVIYEHPGKS